MSNEATKFYTARFKCVSGGFGWGETGATQTIANFEAVSEKKARKLALTYAPGGWIITSIKQQKKEL